MIVMDTFADVSGVIHCTALVYFWSFVSAAQSVLVSHSFYITIFTQRLFRTFFFFNRECF